MVVGLIGSYCMIGLLILGIKKFKNENYGFLALGQALKIGVGIAVIGAVISIFIHYYLQFY